MALNYHLRKYHPEYTSWMSRKFSRLPLLFVPFGFADALAFIGFFGGGSPLPAPLSLLLLLVIVPLEITGFVLTLRALYKARVNSFREDWQQHPVAIVDGPESSGSALSSLGPSASSPDLVGQGEQYLGGFFSLQMGLGRGRGQSIGYGIYFTNQRLFGISQARPRFDRDMALIAHNLSDDDNKRIISELSAMRQFQAKRDEVKTIDLQIPKGLFRTGHLQIGLLNGSVLRIRVGRERPGEQLKALVQIFAPNMFTVS